ncbi:MAG: transporter substrate-binding domain-containing protein [Ilumatobacteraceae bacterium]
MRRRARASNRRWRTPSQGRWASTRNRSSGLRSTFDQAIQPGAKDFDINLQQFSITPRRARNITFSAPYYASNQAVVGFDDSDAVGATSVAELRGLKFGAQSGTTSLGFIQDVIQPEQEAFVYNDNVGAKQALESNQIGAIVLDLPTAFFVTAVEIEGSTIIGQFPVDAGGQADEFGMVFEKDNPLVECVDLALAALRENGDAREDHAEVDDGLRRRPRDRRRVSGRARRRATAGAGRRWVGRSPRGRLTG